MWVCVCVCQISLSFFGAWVWCGLCGGGVVLGGDRAFGSWGGGRLNVGFGE